MNVKCMFDEEPQPLHIHVYVPVQDSLCICAYYCACGVKLGDAIIDKNYLNDG